MDVLLGAGVLVGLLVVLLLINATVPQMVARRRNRRAEAERASPSDTDDHSDPR